MKTTILFVTLVTIGCTTYPLTVLPTFYDNSGRQIDYVETDAIKNAQAIKNGEHYYIVYNKDFLEQYPEDVQRFVLFHEVKHIELGHHDRQFSSPEDLQREADCIALAEVYTPNVIEFLEELRGQDVKTYCGF